MSVVLFWKETLMQIGNIGIQPANPVKPATPPGSNIENRQPPKAPSPQAQANKPPQANTNTLNTSVMSVLLQMQEV
jgi:hypothetical protein